jgi:hypothetical protein
MIAAHTYYQCSRVGRATALSSPDIRHSTYACHLKAGHFEVKSSVLGCADEGGASIESNVDALRSSAHPIVILQSIS